MSSAESGFNAAFERLKTGTTRILPPGSVVSQNNVAREDGKDPSALRKSRYPKLIEEIQSWVANGAPIKDVIAKAKDPRLESQLAAVMLEVNALREERDLLLSKLLVANDRILLLTSKIKEDDDVGKGSAPIVFT